MKTATAYQSMLEHAWRIDGRFYTEDGQRAFLRVRHGPWPKVRLGEIVGDANVWAPSRFARVYAVSDAYGKPYLVPHDTLRYMPKSHHFLSASQTHDYSRYLLTRGWLLVACSGRNLGPCVFVDGFLARFALSHDMIRITPVDEDGTFYVMAFLQTKTGQQVLRRDRNGSVIDHIDVRQVRDLMLPVVADDLKQRSLVAFRRAALIRENARFALDLAYRDFLVLTGLGFELDSIAPTEQSRHTELNVSRLGWRMDVEPHLPIYNAFERAILRTGCAQRIDALASVYRPPGRYKTFYVEDQSYGSPILSGRHLVQFRPVGLKWISPLSFSYPDEYRVHPEYLLIAGDGRAEENLGDCAMVTDDRTNWMASGHCHRICAREEVNVGLLYLALTTTCVQEQIKSLATGSVVDGLSVDDLSSILVPYPTGSQADELGERVRKAWRDFSHASKIEDDAAQELDGSFYQ